jgi:hypothetical protein
MEILFGIGSSLLGLGISTAVPLAFFWLDWSQARDYFLARGCEVHSCWWSPFGPGCLGTPGNYRLFAGGTIYGVRYRDAHGWEHETYVRVGRFYPVEVTQDTVLAGPEAKA